MGVTTNPSATGVFETVRRATKTVTFTGATGLGEVGSVPLFTVTGEVIVERIVPFCSTSLTVTGGVGTASMQLGVTGATNLFVATTDPTAIDAGEFWVDATPDARGVALPAALKDIVITDSIVAEVTNNEAADAEVATLTFDTKANTTSGDYIVISSQSGLTFAVALDKTLAAEVATLTFPDLATSAAGDYFVITAQDGTTYAAAVDKTGSDPEPTGAAWLAVDASRRVQVDVSLDVTAAQVAASFESAIDAITGFTAKIVTDDTAADGTMTFTQQTKGAVADPVPHNADDSGAGTISVAITTPGADAVTPSGAAYTAVDASRKVVADITGDTTAAQVAARAETALNALTGFTALITTDDTAADGTMTLTQTAVGDCNNPVPHNDDDSGAGSITTAETNSGTSTASLTKVNAGVIRFDVLWRPLSPDGNLI